MTFHRQLQDDVAWCWWTRPRATRLGDLLYVGGITSDGSVFAAAHHLREQTTERFVLARLEPDDQALEPLYLLLSRARRPHVAGGGYHFTQLKHP